MSKAYVLITAAHNEEKFIAATIRSVIAQSVLPQRWIIVSDASSDGTDDIVRQHAAQHGFIRLHGISDNHPRNFGAQVDAIKAGYAGLKDLEFAFIGNVDADVVLPPNYYETLLQKLADNPRLGLAGGFIYEDYGRGFKPRRTNSVNSVAHATQFFRRECYEAIGGYLRLPYGGPDWVAEIMVRQRGWTVQAFPELVVQHFRPTASAGGSLRGSWHQGRMDHSLGSLPLFETLKCLRRLPERPFVLGALARLLAFAYSWLCRAPLLVPEDVARYLRAEQRQRLQALFSAHPQNYAEAQPETVPTSPTTSSLQQ